MRKLLCIASFVVLAGCAQVTTAYKLITDTTVTPAVLLTAANSFDILEGTATQYLVYCKTNLTTTACSASNRRTVIKYVRSGRAARNQAETYISSQTNAPSAIYNTLVAAINNLNTSPAQKGAAQ